MPESSRELVEKKIHVISTRIVRGKHAGDADAVRYYGWYRTTSVVLSSLAGIGFGHPLLEVLSSKEPVQGKFATMTGLTGVTLVIGAIAAAIFVILRELYQQRHTEQVALEAISATRSFRRLLEELRTCLSEADPMPNLQDLADRSKALMLHFADVLPEIDDVLREEVARVTRVLIDDHQAHWELPELGGSGGLNKDA